MRFQNPWGGIGAISALQCNLFGPPSLALYKLSLSSRFQQVPKPGFLPVNCDIFDVPRFVLYQAARVGPAVTGANGCIHGGAGCVKLIGRHVEARTNGMGHIYEGCISIVSCENWRPPGHVSADDRSIRRQRNRPPVFALLRCVGLIGTSLLGLCKKAINLISLPFRQDI